MTGGLAWLAFSSCNSTRTRSTPTWLLECLDALALYRAAGFISATLRRLGLAGPREGSKRFNSGTGKRCDPAVALDWSGAAC